MLRPQFVKVLPRAGRGSRRFAFREELVTDFPRFTDTPSGTEAFVKFGFEGVAADPHIRSDENGWKVRELGLFPRHGRRQTFQFHTPPQGVPRGGGQPRILNSELR